MQKEVTLIAAAVAAATNSKVFGLFYYERIRWKNCLEFVSVVEVGAICAAAAATTSACSQQVVVVVKPICHFTTTNKQFFFLKNSSPAVVII